jgi:hypothetical protein
LCSHAACLLGSETSPHRAVELHRGTIPCVRVCVQLSTTITPANPGAGPWPIASDWHWTDGSNLDGPALPANDFAHTKWGGAITAFNRDHCGGFNPTTATGFLAGVTDPCASVWGPYPEFPWYNVNTPPAGCCANARTQPDNSGGFQRCGLVAAGSNNFQGDAST